MKSGVRLQDTIRLTGVLAGSGGTAESLRKASLESLAAAAAIVSDEERPASVACSLTTQNGESFAR